MDKNVDSNLSSAKAIDSNLNSGKTIDLNKKPSKDKRKNTTFNVDFKLKNQSPLTLHNVAPTSKLSMTKGYDKKGAIDLWLEGTELTQSPTNYHRWVGINMVATLLERNVYLPFGGFSLYPNLYCLLVGLPATRKSTALIRGKKVLEQLGYPSFAPSRTDAREFPAIFDIRMKKAKSVSAGDGFNVVDSNFLNDLSATLKTVKDKSQITIDDLNSEINQSKNQYEQSTENLEMELDSISEMPVSERVNAIGVWSSEFMQFFPTQSRPIIEALTDMYDTHLNDRFDYGLQHPISKPVVNIMGAITPAGLASKFQADSFEAGFLTRVIMVHGKSNNTFVDPFKVSFDPTISNELMNKLKQIRSSLRGEMSISSNAKDLVKIIMENMPPVGDIRFISYQGRRTAHLIKLCMIRACSELRMQIRKEDVFWANSVLGFTEKGMGEALGDFGSSPTIKLRNACIKVLNQAEQGFKSSSDLVKGMVALSGESNDNIVHSVLGEMTRDGTLEVTEVNDDQPYALYSLTVKPDEVLDRWDGTLFKKEYIKEWK